MDQVFIQELKIEAVVGIFDWEQRIQQPLVFDLVMDWDVGVAARTGNIDDALDYAQVSEQITQLIQGRAWGLIEEVAESVAHLLLHEFHVPRVEVTVHKPTAVPTAQSVGVRLVRQRERL